MRLFIIQIKQVSLACRALYRGFFISMSCMLHCIVNSKENSKIATLHGNEKSQSRKKSFCVLNSIKHYLLTSESLQPNQIKCRICFYLLINLYVLYHRYNVNHGHFNWQQWLILLRWLKSEPILKGHSVKLWSQLAKKFQRRRF